jgi:hypothetical protein
MLPPGHRNDGGDHVFLSRRAGLRRHPVDADVRDVGMLRSHLFDESRVDEVAGR